MTQPIQPVIHDKRRIDPQTGEVRQAAEEQPAASPAGDGRDERGVTDARGAAQAQDVSDTKGAGAATVSDTNGGQNATDADAGPGTAEPDAEPELPAPDVAALQKLVDERTADLQRLQAEYANYKKRVDRDRALSRQAGIEAVVRDLLPVLDSVEAAREHDELVGGFKLVADELEKIATKYGLTSFGEVGEAFDPQVHEALMQMPYDGEITEPTVSAVMQKGVVLHDRVLRPARVGVANPQGT